jgi:hypothetical protein
MIIFILCRTIANAVGGDSRSKFDDTTAEPLALKDEMGNIHLRQNIDNNNAMGGDERSNLDDTILAVQKETADPLPLRDERGNVHWQNEKNPPCISKSFHLRSNVTSSLLLVKPDTTTQRSATHHGGH